MKIKHFLFLMLITVLFGCSTGQDEVVSAKFKVYTIDRIQTEIDLKKSFEFVSVSDNGIVMVSNGDDDLKSLDEAIQGWSEINSSKEMNYEVIRTHREVKPLLGSRSYNLTHVKFPSVFDVFSRLFDRLTPSK
jgi:hypothetical protein